ncbi:MAG: hypothetical protein LBT50_07320 [Prevotellaceae bacterium]|jgi:hypothetical protein|nr:hypothetical protein [Prevotellaceae bacterium]
MEYKELTNYKKIEQIQELRFCKGDHHYAVVYLKALLSDDTQMINEYEQFGTDTRHIIMNKHSYDRGLLFGFTGIKFNKYGWLDNEDFLEIETFEFPHRKNWAVFNDITIGKGNNGKWTYGINYSTGGYGGGYGICVWGEIFDTRKECLIAALRKIMDKHHKSRIQHKNDTLNFNAEYSKTVMKKVNELYDTITGRKSIQLSLF